MFKEVQNGCTIHILEKVGGIVKYHVGTIINKTDPRFDPKNIGQTGMPLSADRVMDINVEFDGKSQIFVVHENSNIAFAQNISMSCDPSYIINEVKGLLKQSEDAIANIDTHKANVEECNKILGMLDPHIGDTQEQKKRLDIMENKIDSMSSLITQIAASLHKNEN